LSYYVKSTKKEHEDLALEIATIFYVRIYNIRVLYFPLCKGRVALL
jgi:hypothetical protein